MCALVMSIIRVAPVASARPTSSRIAMAVAPPCSPLSMARSSVSSTGLPIR